MNWYYAEGAQQKGPYTETDFSALVKAGTIQSSTLVWREGLAEWQPWAQLQTPLPSNPAAPPVATLLPVDGVVCSQCGALFPADQTIRYGDLAVCAACKPVFLQKLKEGVLVSGDLRYAGFWIRCLAKLIDGLILGLVFFLPVFLLFFGSIRSGSNPNAALGFQLLIQFGSILVNGLYTVFFLARYSATPGKMVCGLRVVMADGNRLGLGRCIGRYFAEMLSGMICYIGYIIVAFDEQKRGLHDHICTTRVIHK